MAFYVAGSLYLVSAVIPFCLQCCKHDQEDEEKGDGEIFVLESTLALQYVSTC